MSLRALLRTAVAGVGLSVGSLAVWVNSGDLVEDSSFSLDYDAHRPAPRARRLSDLTQKGSKENPFDVLVVGGGATGAGIALDAATRGLKYEREVIVVDVVFPILFPPFSLPLFMNTCRFYSYTPSLFR